MDPSSDCPACGCNDVESTRSAASEGRRFTREGVVRVRMLTERRRCNHCGKSWTHKSEEAIEKPAKSKAKRPAKETNEETT